MELSLLPGRFLPLASAEAVGRKAAWRRRRQTAFAYARLCRAADVAPEGNRRWFASLLAATAVAGIGVVGGGEEAGAVSTSRRALRAAKIPEEEFTTLPNGLKYYDIKVGSGAEAVKGSRVAVHYVAKWRGITFMTSRQGMGVGGGTPYGFDVGNSERGNVLKGLDLGVEGMKVGGQADINSNMSKRSVFVLQSENNTIFRGYSSFLLNWHMERRASKKFLLMQLLSWMSSYCLSNKVHLGLL